jgi:hypothetical protein
MHSVKDAQARLEVERLGSPSLEGSHLHSVTATVERGLRRV